MDSKINGTSPSISGFNAMTTTELLYAFQKYIEEHAVKGDTGRGIQKIEVSYDRQATVTLVYFNFIYTDSTNETYTITIPNGEQGEQGVGFSAIETQGYAETDPNYTTTKIKITKTDGTSSVWTAFARHGKDGENANPPTTGEYVTKITKESDGKPYLSIKFDNNIISACGNFYAPFYLTPTGETNNYLFVLNGNVTVQNPSSDQKTIIINGISVIYNKSLATGSQGVYFVSVENEYIFFDTATNTLSISFTLIDRYGNKIDNSKIEEYTRADGIAHLITV